ncbi:substrate-binding domain-containing protein [Dactylosporangium sp. CS-047395]|uniref:substrate-binding domain-containing protein n=1 Tax=Dactylosporangium sp. CS-047395 TaxID=3239936 RepID=UPI003D8AACBF
MGRHQAGSRSVGAILRGVGLVLAVALVAGAGWYALHRDSGGQDGASCPTTLRVVTASSFTTVVSAAGRELRTGPDCVLLDVTSADGRPAAGQLGQVSADVWIPDDAAWATIAPPGQLVATDKDNQAKRDTGAGQTLATTPIYMVTDGPTANKIKGGEGGGWWALAGLLNNKSSGVRMVVRDPSLSGDGLVAAGAVGEAVWLKQGMDASSLALNSTLAATRTVNHDLAATPDVAGEVGLVPEYALLPIMDLAQNRTYLAGADNTALMRYTWLPTAAAARDPERVAALQKLLTAFKSPAVQDAMNVAGLRTPGGPRPEFEGGDALPEPTAKPFDVLQSHHVQHVFATWDPEDRRSNLLIAVDIAGATTGSGSGGSTPSGGPAGKQPPIEVLKAGCRVVGDLMPVGSRLGLWEISPGQPGGYRKLLPTDRLDDTSRAAFTRSVSTLTTHKAGAGLLDTIVAAYQSVRDDWHDDMFNQVFILTDDANKDSANAQAVATMVQKLKDLQDEERPVTISIVVLGKKDAADRLKTALSTLGAGTYVDNAQSGEDVQAAFIHVVAGGLHE